MSIPTNIVVIGAGSASFGENTLSAIMRSKSLCGSTLRLVDRNTYTLDTVQRLALRLNHEWNADMNITAHTDHKEALSPDTKFVVSAIEVGAREGLWQKDFEIPIKFGVRQPYAENGGPGGFAHAARNIGPVMEIVHDMESICPKAWFINFTNPMVHICDAINRHSKIRSVGLCHQIFAGYTMVGMALANDLGFQIPEGITGMHADPTQAPLHELVKKQVVPRIDIVAAGLNHFTWALAIHDRQTGEDLYSLLRKRFFELDPSFEPLTRIVFENFDIFPIPGDTHLCEYLPWLSDPVTKPWEKYNLRLYNWDLNANIREFQHARHKSMADGEAPIDGLLDSDSEGALEVIEAIAGAQTHYHLAGNVPNCGQVPGLPQGAAVETPMVVNGDGIRPVFTKPMPKAVVELLNRETTVAQLCVDATVEGDRTKAKQCLLLDPVITDIDAAQKILDAYLEEYKEYLPQFWK